MRTLLTDRRGATGAEYALILAIIGGIIAISAFGLGGSVANAMDRSSGQINNCGGGC